MVGKTIWVGSNYKDRKPCASTLPNCTKVYSLIHPSLHQRDQDIACIKIGFIGWCPESAIHIPCVTPPKSMPASLPNFTWKGYSEHVAIASVEWSAMTSLTINDRETLCSWAFSHAVLHSVHISCIVWSSQLYRSIQIMLIDGWCLWLNV